MSFTHKLSSLFASQRVSKARFVATPRGSSGLFCSAAFSPLLHQVNSLPQPSPLASLGTVRFISFDRFSSLRVDTIVQKLACKLRSTVKRIKRYATGFVVIFIAIYGLIYFSITSVLCEFLKVQSNSLPIPSSDGKKSA